MNKIEPTQADRDAAADYWRDFVAKVGECIVERSIRRGDMDEQESVQRFARHRLGAELRVNALEVALAGAEQRAATAEHRLHSFRQGRAARSAQLAQFIKDRVPELWPDYAAISVNGSHYGDDYTLEPVFEREMNILRYRVEAAEEKLAAYHVAKGEA